MNRVRTIDRVLKSRPTIEGAGVHLKRAFGYDQVPLLDPFLLLDDFHSDNARDYMRGFPWHPHRGIETITYVLHGEVEHGDSMGNSGTISAGDVQWMTAGSGIIHQEMPRGEKDGLLQGFQLWANLPASQKMMEPRYRGITRDEIPRLFLDNGTDIKVVCGTVEDVTGPVTDIMIKPEYLDITIPAHASFVHRVEPDHTVLAYVISGSGYFDERRDAFAYEVEGSNYFDMDRNCVMRAETLIVYAKGDHISVSTADESVRFLLVSGKPVGEPVAWYGPIVMNTQEELKRAFEEYRQGTFLKHNV